MEKAVQIVSEPGPTLKGMAAVRQLEVDPALQERRTTSDYVADSLRAAIIEGQFDDGEELNQVELARHFRVSRVPVREALRRLEAEGLISAEAHRRAVVVGFSPKRVQEIFELRALLEGFLLEQAAPVIGPERIAELRGLCDTMDTTDDQGRWLELNHTFHQQLLAPSESLTALALVDQLRGQVGRYVRRYGVLSRTQEASLEHRQIVDALEAGDVPLARRALEEHIAQTLRGIAGQL